LVDKVWYAFLSLNSSNVFALSFHRTAKRSMHGDLGLVINISLSLVLALVLGLVTQKLRLSPIVGYLLAGIALGPNTPGPVGNVEVATELAEIGVVLLMFGVGMHFNLGDLLAVRRIAIPGAVGQIAVATALGLAAALVAGFSIGAGLVIGLAISVASTVVLIRVLLDNDVLQTPQGHIAVGWLIVEDIATVLVLVALPAAAGAFGANAAAGQNVFVVLGLAVVKVAALAVLVVAGGKIVFPWLLRLVAQTRSRELFTLTILALALAVATGSAVGFGVSMALGAFLAGMVVGQTEVSHQAAADALPMRDAFSVLFFVSVGMLFDPKVIVERPGMLAALIAIVLLAKPLTAFAIVWLLRYSIKSALTVSIALAQIGEFSFLLADEARRLNLLPSEAHSLLVACAILSITLNPLLFRAIVPVENWLRRRPGLWRALNQRADARGADLNRETAGTLAELKGDDEAKTAVIVGYGPVGQTACRILREFNVRPVVIDLNLDTVRRLTEEGTTAIYGDAAQPDILEAAGMRKARFLLLTVPDVFVRTAVILAARELNPEARVFARARYIGERAWLEEVGAAGIVTEEAETAVGLAVLLLREVGADKQRVHDEVLRIQTEMRKLGEFERTEE
jgi:CPA2 family monovalent cation:H+ antiporter-2